MIAVITSYTNFDGGTKVRTAGIGLRTSMT